MHQPGSRHEQPTDRELIHRWRDGDEQAAAELVGRHAPALARFAAGLGAWEHAEEIVQDTFVRAFDSLATFRSDSSLRTWLFTILRRLVLDRRRAARRRPESVDIATVEIAVDSGSSGLDEVIADETRKRVSLAVQRLSRMQREVFTLRVGEGMSYREIAEILGSTEGAARVHYHNALRAVKEALDD